MKYRIPGIYQIQRLSYTLTFGGHALIDQKDRYYYIYYIWCRDILSLRRIPNKKGY